MASLPDVSNEDSQNVILNELERLLSDQSIGTPEDRAVFLHFKAMRQKTPDKAAALFREAIAIYPEPTPQNAQELYTLHTMLGDMYRRMRKIKEAGDHLRTAVELAKRFDPQYEQNAELVMTVANFYNDTMQFDEAIKLLGPMEERLRQTKPLSFTYAGVLRKLAVVTANLGNTQQGLALLEQSWKLYERLCADNEEMLAFHKNNVIDRIRKQIISAQGEPKKFVGGA